MTVDLHVDLNPRQTLLHQGPQGSKTDNVETSHNAAKRPVNKPCLITQSYRCNHAPISLNCPLG